MKKTIFTFISALMFTMFSTSAFALDYHYKQNLFENSPVRNQWQVEANRYLGGRSDYIDSGNSNPLIQDFRVLKDPKSNTLFFVVEGQPNAYVKVGFKSARDYFTDVPLQEVSRGRYFAEYTIREYDALYRKDFTVELSYAKRINTATVSRNGNSHDDDRPAGGYVSANQWRSDSSNNQPQYQPQYQQVPQTYPVMPNGNYGNVQVPQQPQYPSSNYQQRAYNNNNGYNNYNQQMNVNNGVVIRVETRDGGDSLGGAAVGALAGGVLGHQVGKGSGRDAATILGVIGGGLIGNEVGKNQNGGRMWLVHVRFDDGSTNVFNFNQDPMIGVGSYVMRDGNNLIRR